MHTQFSSKFNELPLKSLDDGTNFYVYQFLLEQSSNNYCGLKDVEKLAHSPFYTKIVVYFLMDN